MLNRIQSLKNSLSQIDISALLVSKPENQYYLSGFICDDCYIVITPEQDYLLTDFRNIEAAKAATNEFQIIRTSRDYGLTKFLKELSPDVLGIEEKYTSIYEYKSIRDSVDCPIVSGDGLIEKLRMVKEKEELKAIKRAQALCDSCFSYILNYIKPGLTEKQIAFEIERFLRTNGADKLSFDTICVSGVRTSLPHGVPSTKIIEKGELITIDFGCIIDGYCSDMTRTLALGHVDQEKRDVYNIVLEAQQRACETIRSGLACKDVDKAARDIIVNNGYKDAFGHGTGHGVGLEIHEDPSINSSSDEILSENMAITIEPGIYLPGKFGVRIEDLVFVTSTGIINTTTSDKNLTII